MDKCKSDFPFLLYEAGVSKEFPPTLTLKTCCSSCTYMYTLYEVKGTGYHLNYRGNWEGTKPKVYHFAICNGPLNPFEPTALHGLMMKMKGRIDSRLVDSNLDRDQLYNILLQKSHKRTKTTFKALCFLLARILMAKTQGFSFSHSLLLWTGLECRNACQNFFTFMHVGLLKIGFCVSLPSICMNVRIKNIHCPYPILKFLVLMLKIQFCGIASTNPSVQCITNHNHKSQMKEQGQ
jgi:hypothetical protein